jgi:beta-lactamase superfamily II metal-dependent hydrolase
MISRVAIGLAIALAIMTSSGSAKDLQLIAIDVEGGAANLYITPGGTSLLIDTGFPAGMGEPQVLPLAEPAPSSARRIAAAARKAGLTRIDHVLVTHYHVDHVGGVAELMTLIPVGGFIDHGPNRELPVPGTTPSAIAPVITYRNYVAAIAGKPRRQLRAGETLNLDGLRLTAVASDGEVIAHPLRGAGAPGIGCATAADEPRDGGEENWRSLGVLLRWGQTRILSLGDATLRLENRLVCPTDLIGRVDLLFASNHGSNNAVSDALLATLRPRVIFVSNGPTKGADATVLARLQALADRPAVWQLHRTIRHSVANTSPEQTANLDASSNNNLTVMISDSGKLAVNNSRTGIAVTYHP